MMHPWPWTLKALSLIGLTLITLPVRAENAQNIIQKARDFVSDEKTLLALDNIVYIGTYKTPDGPSGEISLRVKKPYFQQQRREHKNHFEISSVNGSEGFIMRVPKSSDTQGKIVIMEYKQINEMITNAIENLYFYRGTEQKSGQIIDEGLTTFEGRAAYKIIFEYPGNIVYERYFSPETGEIIATIHKAMTIKEINHKVVDGIRLPETVVASKDGKILYELNFSTVLTNQNMPKAAFDFPKVQTKKTQ